jgi:hypothetical protein
MMIWDWFKRGGWVIGLIIVFAVAQTVWLFYPNIFSFPAAASKATPTPQWISLLQMSHTGANITPLENRVVMTFWGDGRYLSSVKAVEVALRNPNQPDEVVWAGEATLYQDYFYPYWVVYPNFPQEGLWQLEVQVTTTSQQVFPLIDYLQVKPDGSTIERGKSAPASVTPVLQAADQLYKISSAARPNPNFYTQTIAEAVASGQPSLIVFASPGLCGDVTSTPVIDQTLPYLWERYSGKVNFVHVEIYDPAHSAPTRTLNEWGIMPKLYTTRHSTTLDDAYGIDYRYDEPWLYLVNKQGVVVGRFAGPVAASELDPILYDLVNS